MSAGPSSAPIIGSPLQDQALLTQLIQCADLPSPVGVVMRILELGQDPEVSFGEVAKVLTLDPALSARLLRMANSPLYARQRKTDNLRQAIKLFGVEGTITLALSFSVVNNLRERRCQGFDYQWFWHRSLAAATCAQVIAERLSMANKEELFLAALLQDIGMLALARARPGLYGGLGESPMRHEQVRACEREALGIDHSGLGAWLLKQWNFPEDLQTVVMCSHDPADAGPRPDLLRSAAVVALASDMAELWSEPNAQALLRRTMKRAEDLLGIDGDAFTLILEESSTVVRDIAYLFDVEIEDSNTLDMIIGQARELIVLRHIRVMQKSAILEDQTRRLEEENRRDVLTGLFNRAHLQQALTQAFESAQENSCPLTVIFIDLDRFKHINDQHGHLCGDRVLRSMATILEACIRSGDIVSRYGGEEFVVVLPGTGAEGARMSCDRLLSAFRRMKHRVDENIDIVVTASIGVAVHGEGMSFGHVEDILSAADEALYAAKNQGRDRCVFYQG